MKQRVTISLARFVLVIGMISLFHSCKNAETGEKPSWKSLDPGQEPSETLISETGFQSVPDYAKPWVYYWWLKGNVTKELITRDLEEMKNKGIGGFLLFDSRGYWDDYHTGNIPVPLPIKMEFMSPEWRQMVKFTMEEASRLGLKMSINLANTGGSLRGPWDMAEDGPKELIWTAATINGPMKISVPIDTPTDKKFFHDAALMVVRIKTTQRDEPNENDRIDLNSNWSKVTACNSNSLVADKVIDISHKVKNGMLNWEVPEGRWKIIRFGYNVIGEEGSVDVLNSTATEKYFHLMGEEILKDAGSLAGVTLTRFYNVSWEGGQPNWTVGFEKEFKKYRGYNMYTFMPALTGMIVKDSTINNRFMHDYLMTVSNCFENNCYATIGRLCHEKGIRWHSENGGPWPRKAPMFKEADQLTFWGKNDMPQGEFWCNRISDLQNRSNVRYTAMAAHTYGQRLVAVEAFTHMDAHWTKYPAYLKPFADVNLVDGANFFIWHTFTASPLDIKKPGFEYFAGTHLNPNVTWWNKAGGFLEYIGRCQYMLRTGQFVADVCCYVSDKNYVTWGRGEKWNENSSLKLDDGYTYDLINTEVLLNRLSVKNGQLVLPDGMSYKLLVVDISDPYVSADVLERITELVKDGAVVLLGQKQPYYSSGLKNYPACDQKVIQRVNNLWSLSEEKENKRSMGKGTIYTNTSVKEVLNDNKILPDFEGPFEYIHRSNPKGQDIYFIAGEGKSECTFRINGKKPEIWNPVSGKIADAPCYRFTDEGRVIVLIDLPKNGSAFVVFRNEPDKDHFISIEGNDPIEITNQGKGPSDVTFWHKGDYTFTSSDGNKKEISAITEAPIELNGSWKVKFEPATESNAIETIFQNLLLWNEHPNPEIKYFSGTATYTKTFSLTQKQAEIPIRLQLGSVHDIARVWINGQDMGIVWTYPWMIELTGIAKEGNNEVKIEVTNCWANRLIGDAGLPEEKRITQTNVRLVPDRKEFPEAFKAFSSQDPLLPSGLAGPVLIEFGINRRIEF